MSQSPYLPAVITRCERQGALVDRLVKHCEDLDGTKLTVIDDLDTTSAYGPQCAANALHMALQQMKGRPFIWLEADSIPFKAGWRAAISAEYKKCGKAFLMPDLSGLDKSDLASGIGVYPAEGHFLIPKSFPQHGWDWWIERHMSQVIARTNLIQHSYGKYFMGHAKGWEFPRDKAILKPDAMIFHKDAAQGLLDCFSESPYELNFETAKQSPTSLTPVLKHSGDIGDIIAALPILRAKGGGDIILFHDPEAPKGMCARESLEGKRFDAIVPLLEAQPYVYSVTWGKGSSAKGFREVLRPQTESLTERQARHHDMWPIDLSPWIHVPGPVAEHQRVICCRSPRYHLPFEFPWKDAVETYGDRILFVGLPDEHAAFEEAVDHKVEHAKTDNFLDVARIMAGAPQVIANQSSPLWVAMGLGRKVIVEGFPHAPNTEIKRPGSYWVYTPIHAQNVRNAFAAVRAKQK